MYYRSIKQIVTVVLLGLLVLILNSCQTRQKHTEPGWPVITKENKPWTRWWWMGNSANPKDLKAAMEAYSKAGLGGLEITTIYGVHGYEDQFVKFLSPEWMEKLKYTLQEGKRLDLGIDLAMASGWPFGGIWVTPEDACRYMDIKKYSLKEGEQLQEKIISVQTPMLRSISRKNLDISTLKYPVNANADSLQNWAIDQIRYPVPLPLKLLMAYSDNGEVLNLTGKVNKDGILNWIAPTGEWKLYAIFEGWHGKMVERAGPGGEGDVIDHFSAKAIDNYLGHFDNSFKGHDLTGLRAYFNDSYEVDDARGQADYTPLLFDEFQKRRGYDLQKYIPALTGNDSEENNTRVLCDYRETVSDLILENYTQRWHDWAAKSGKLIRNQSHGAPANVLDLYAAADIPESETNDVIKLKMASSVAHVTGKKYASSESATWLRDHFLASLSDVKNDVIDRAMLSGINHLFYHGTTFSPQDAPWPGWMFYASVHFGPTNPIWEDFPALNKYIARVQSFLQAGKPDNDLLVYFPIFDEYANRGRSLLYHFEGSAKGTAFRTSAEILYEKGYAFDCISDRQMLNLKFKSGKIQTGGANYQAILLPPLNLIPLETLDKILTLAKNGATILMEKLPSDVPGLGKLDERQVKFKALVNGLKFEQVSAKVQKAKIGKGEVILGTLEDILLQANIRHETMFDKGLECIRRVDGEVTSYFIANRGAQAIDGMVQLASPVQTVVLYNPMNDEFGKAITNPSEKTGEVYLQLNPNESCLLQVFPEKVNIQDYKYYKAEGEAKPIIQEWELSFVKGGPELPKSVKLLKLESWTDLGDETYRAFSGTAVYKTSFAKPSDAAIAYRLDLGKVANSAHFVLNGKELATLICQPFSVIIPDELLKADNLLEVHVTNLMANRMIDHEKKGMKYKIFYNVNFPANNPNNRGADGLFTTAGWQPLESGMIGPVTLTPLQLINKN